MGHKLESKHPRGYPNCWDCHVCPSLCSEGTVWLQHPSTPFLLHFCCHKKEKTQTACFTVSCMGRLVSSEDPVSLSYKGSDKAKDSCNWRMFFWCGIEVTLSACFWSLKHSTTPSVALQPPPLLHGRWLKPWAILSRWVGCSKPWRCVPYTQKENCKTTM